MDRRRLGRGPVRFASNAAAPDGIGHLDWQVENLGFNGGDIAAIYDWESVALAPEAVVVGSDAVQFCTDWGGGEDDPLPTVADMMALVEDYEKARGRPFDDQECEHLDAANLALIAYGARCQNSDTTLYPELVHHPA